jgi:uncharacterized protein (DUF427 family)
VSAFGSSGPIIDKRRISMRPSQADHKIAISPALRRVRVFCGDMLIADSANALQLEEGQYPQVYYVPRADADMGRLVKTARTTHCPFKGDCSYFSVVTGTATLADAVWSYEQPYPAVARIAGHLAFYPDRLTIEVD